MGIEEAKRWGIMRQPVAKWDKRTFGVVLYFFDLAVERFSIKAQDFSRL